MKSNLLFLMMLMINYCPLFVAVPLWLKATCMVTGLLAIASSAVVAFMELRKTKLQLCVAQLSGA